MKSNSIEPEETWQGEQSMEVNMLSTFLMFSVVTPIGGGMEPRTWSVEVWVRRHSLECSKAPTLHAEKRGSMLSRKPLQIYRKTWLSTKQDAEEPLWPREEVLQRRPLLGEVQQELETLAKSPLVSLVLQSVLPVSSARLEARLWVVLWAKLVAMSRLARWSEGLAVLWAQLHWLVLASVDQLGQLQRQELLA
mmetsp:Transcript_16755/g.46093  ORF Transcript_16755/g.46093 Transcript_16755/m.46093 type:complete len:193 (-) Transcript_16755:790-1368(-)